MATVTVIDGPVISAGESLSALIDISAPATGITRIICPPDWTYDPGGANVISFLWSPDKNEYFNVFDLATGTEILIPIVPNALFVLPRDVWRTGFMKFRSGPARAPIIQEAQRVFRCVLE